MSTAADVVDLDDYRRTENGMYVPASAEPTSEVEPVEPGDQQQVPTSVPQQLSTAEVEEPVSPDVDGVTWRVRLARRGSAVQQRLSEIPARQVIRRGSRVERAAELEELADDPRAEAYSNRRARTWLMSMAGLGIALGVGISSSTAQQTITSFMGWAASSVAGVAAYGADPALGLVLFATLGARILASARGVAVPEVARQALNKIELVLFSLVALLNAGPSLGHLLGDLFSGEWARLGPDAMVLVIHCLGPVLVASGVFGVPYMALILAAVTAATNAKRVAAASPGEPGQPAPAPPREKAVGVSSENGSSAPGDLHGKKSQKTSAASSASTSPTVTAKVSREPQRRSQDEMRGQLRRAIDDGEIDPATAPVNSVAKHLGCRWGTAKALLDEHAA